MQPSKKLKKTKIIVGVTGGIAAYKIPDLVRKLQVNYDVQVIMTKSAQDFVTPTTLSVLSGKNVALSLDVDNGLIPHISLLQDVKLVLIAPMTANFGAKLAHGFADDLLSTLLLKLNCEVPVILCPSMNTQMFLNVATQENLKTLKNRGYEFIEPRTSLLACGEYGTGAMPEITTIQATIDAFLGKSSTNK
ncbi:phosphopantothenoylcysteine decarboxylase/phosphopantothenoylcysteine decarboxylase/phosphopantothenate--cysteine ligase [Entomoplasma freundtii]|uniref:flavoprotein n=1 Tax=Entomoplasma freundtii TaxID=74700 RepID=UPI000C28DD68|nr:flavoprotein [Entomoplasma freundtii]TDY58230.1 phosphopantothenoylcysteine decarboxylase/phosphopantothenoylcysteine decarboxylase/phosphopantothenate--cysteine ligase [Entomoplasma freundtii]